MTVPYVGTNLNIDLILQSAWLLLFSFIPKHEKNYIEFKNTSVIISIVLLIIHFFSENEFYSYNSKIFSTSLENNYLLYSIVLTFFIYLKLLSQMLESRIKNILYFLPFLFLITGTYNSANLNIVFISLMFIGIITLFKNLKSKLLRSHT